MSREIKFRAWDKDENKMIYPDKSILTCLNEKGNYLTYDVWEGDIFSNIELMQFTGLHDKDGKEIWEGDIVQTNGKERGYVNFVCGRFTPTLEDDLVGEYVFPLTDIYLEVIGNIYENPELLEEKR